MGGEREERENDKKRGGDRRGEERVKEREREIGEKKKCGAIQNRGRAA
jgi:hypothetical protein